MEDKHEQISIVKKPTKFLLPGVMFGEECVIHKLREDLYLTSLNYDEFGRDLIDIEKNCDASTRSQIFKLINPVIEKINETHKEKNKLNAYLFVANDKEVYFVNYSDQEGMRNSRESKLMAKKLKVKTLKIDWKGVFTRQVELAFFEDIIVQRY